MRKPNKITVKLLVENGACQAQMQVFARLTKGLAHTRANAVKLAGKLNFSWAIYNLLSYEAAQAIHSDPAYNRAHSAYLEAPSYKENALGRYVRADKKELNALNRIQAGLFWDYYYGKKRA